MSDMTCPHCGAVVESSQKIGLGKATLKTIWRCGVIAIDGKPGRQTEACKERAVFHARIAALEVALDWLAGVVEDPEAVKVARAALEGGTK